jgi:hypothetical protein
MSMTTHDDLDAGPLQELHDAYIDERGQVQPPSGWRDDLTVPLKAAEQAVKAASELRGKLTNIRAHLDVGAISREQANVQRTHIIADVRRQVEQSTDSGRRVMEALPHRVYAQAWPDDVPSNVDWVTTELEWSSVPADEAIPTFQSMVRGAIDRDDLKTAKGLMSRRGRALLAARIGKEQTDGFWPELQHDATTALESVSGDAGLPGRAFAQLDAVGRAFTAGVNLADELLNTNSPP